MRDIWSLHEIRAEEGCTPVWAAGLIPSQHGRMFLVVGDDGFVGAFLHEPLPGGVVHGVRMAENGMAWHLIDATNLESALLGVRDAFRDERLDVLVRLN